MMVESCWSPFDSDVGDVLKWSLSNQVDKLKCVPLADLVEKQRKGACCFSEWGPLQMALLSGSEETVGIILHALANSVPWGHEVPPELRFVELGVLLHRSHHWLWREEKSPNMYALVDRIQKDGWKVHQTCPWEVQRVLVAGRKQVGCVWSLVPRDILHLILRMSSEVVFVEKKKGN